jgi:hypothetical protein
MSTVVHEGAFTAENKTRINDNFTALNDVAQTASATAPSAADDPGTAGQIAYEDGFLYVCVDTDTWQRVAIATW